MPRYRVLWSNRKVSSIQPGQETFSMSQNTISILSFFLAYDVENLFVFFHLASIYKIFTAEVHVLFLYRGTDEHFGISDKIDIVNSTLGKALGGAAGRK